MKNREERALMVAELAHGNQSYDIYPYVYHLKEVARIARELGYDDDIIIAAYLHDILEDTSLSYNDIKQAFGLEVAEIVYCVTDELGRNRKERKAKTYPKIKSSWKATVVKICDRAANIKHSLDYSPKMATMYLKEHDDFKKNIYDGSHPVIVKIAWDYLDEIMKLSKK